jgi:hypothetical protein
VLPVVLVLQLVCLAALSVEPLKDANCYHNSRGIRVDHIHYKVAQASRRQICDERLGSTPVWCVADSINHRCSSVRFTAHIRNHFCPYMASFLDYFRAL